MFYSIIIAIVIIAGLIISFHAYTSTNQRETIKFYTSLSAVVGILIAGAQLFDSVKHERQTAAFAFNDKWQEMPILAIDEAIEKIKEMQNEGSKSSDNKEVTLQTSQSHEKIKIILKETNLSKLSKFLNDDPKAHENLMKTLNFFDQLGLAIKYNYVDEDIVCNIFSTISVDYYLTVSWIVDWHRKTQNEPNLYASYEWLYQRWKGGCQS